MVDAQALQEFGGHIGVGILDKGKLPQPSTRHSRLKKPLRRLHLVDPGPVEAGDDVDRVARDLESGVDRPGFVLGPDRLEKAVDGFRVERMDNLGRGRRDCLRPISLGQLGGGEHQVVVVVDQTNRVGEETVGFCERVVYVRVAESRKNRLRGQRLRLRHLGEKAHLDDLGAFVPIETCAGCGVDGLGDAIGHLYGTGTDRSRDDPGVPIVEDSVHRCGIRGATEAELGGREHMAKPPEELIWGVALPSDSHGLVDDRFFVDIEAGFRRIQGHGLAFDREGSGPCQILILDYKDRAHRFFVTQATDGCSNDIDASHHFALGDAAYESVCRKQHHEEPGHHDHGSQQRMYPEGRVLVHVKGRPNRPEPWTGHGTAGQANI